MSYVDGFIMPVPARISMPTRNSPPIAGIDLEGIRRARYVECLGNDVPYGELTSFPRAVHGQG